MRSDLPEGERLAVQVGRGVLCRFDRAVRSFYKRCKKGQNPGFPRFKSSRRWSIFCVVEAGVPSLRFRDKGDRLGIALGGGAKVKELRVVRTPLRTEIHVVVRHPEGEMPQVEPLQPSGDRCWPDRAPHAL